MVSSSFFWLWFAISAIYYNIYLTKWESFQKSPGKLKMFLGIPFYCCAVFPVSFAPLVRRSTDRFDDRFPKMDNMSVYFDFVHTIYPFPLFCPWTICMSIVAKIRVVSLEKIWRFQIFLHCFSPLYLGPFSLQGGTFCLRGNFSKRSPSIKESKKGKEKNLKTRKKVQITQWKSIAGTFLASSSLL